MKKSLLPVYAAECRGARCCKWHRRDRPGFDCERANLQQSFRALPPLTTTSRSAVRNGPHPVLNALLEILEKF